MHNKFAVLDQKVVWTGSWNYTDGATYKNNENAIAIESPDIAAVYTVKFNAMFAQFNHTTSARSDNSMHKVLSHGAQVYFAPEDKVADILKSMVSHAKTSIKFMAFVITFNELKHALMDRSKNGIEVRGILEKQLNRSFLSDSVSNWLVQNGNLDVRFDGNPRFLHHNCIIIDDELVITGSLNFSRNSMERNDENLIIIPDKTLAMKYKAEFQRLWPASQKMNE